MRGGATERNLLNRQTMPARHAARLPGHNARHLRDAFASHERRLIRYCNVHRHSHEHSQLRGYDLQLVAPYIGRSDRDGTGF